MDKNRFDGFTRQLAKRENRRQALKTLFAGGVGTAATVLASGETSAAKTDCCPADAPTLCNLTCTDTITDTQNCGGCGFTCEADERCYKSACESLSIAHCTVVDDCPGSDTECAKRTCKKGVCGVSYMASGKKVTTQTTGDCQRNVCDGAGNITTIADNTDKPAAQGECWSGVCVDGVPQQNPLPSGRKCSTGKCNGAGYCSGSTPACTVAADCPATGSECIDRTCINGNCGTSNLPFGTLLASQTAGDCKQDICDGNGGTTTQLDTTDVINTHYPEECVETVCGSDGTPVTQNKPYGSSCGSGYCDGNNVCLDCLSDSDCLDSGMPNATTVCTGGYCTYQCFPGYTNCPNGIGCVNTSIDPDHCGSCDHVCSVINGHAICANGACSLVECFPGYGNCNSTPADGCETNFMSDSNNCGLCNNKCTGGTTCQGGQCL